MPPVSSTATIDSRPSVERVAIAIRPSATTKSSWAGSPCENSRSPFASVCSVGLAAQLLQHVLGKRGEQLGGVQQSALGHAATLPAPGHSGFSTTAGVRYHG